MDDRVLGTEGEKDLKIGSGPCRLREELGGTSIAEWKAAGQLGFRTTVLALNTEPGMVCSMTHADMPNGLGEFRVASWKLNKDYSIDIQGRTTTSAGFGPATR